MSVGSRLVLELTKNDTCVDVAETEARLGDDLHIGQEDGGVRDALGVRGQRRVQILAVERSMDETLVELEEGCNAFDAAGSPERVTDHRLGRVDERHLRRGQAQGGAPALDLVWVGEGRREMPVDGVDLFR